MPKVATTHFCIPTPSRPHSSLHLPNTCQETSELLASFSYRRGLFRQVTFSWRRRQCFCCAGELWSCARSLPFVKGLFLEEDGRYDSATISGAESPFDFLDRCRYPCRSRWIRGWIIPIPTRRTFLSHSHSKFADIS